MLTGQPDAAIVSPQIHELEQAFDRPHASYATQDVPTWAVYSL